jgi:hypothetical protein
VQRLKEHEKTIQEQSEVAATRHGNSQRYTTVRGHRA